MIACRPLPFRAALPRRIVLALGLLIPSVTVASPADDDPAGFGRLPASPGTVAGALGGLANPAAWGAADAEMAFLWSDDDLDDWAVSFGSPLGLSVERSPGVWRYRTGFSFGQRSLRQGLAWRWSAGGSGAGAESGLESGALWRPGRFVSLGVSGFLSAQSTRQSALADVGLRPFGNSRLTLFADASLRSGQRGEDAPWSAGAELRPIDGLQLTARYRESPVTGEDEVLIGIGVVLNAAGSGFARMTRVDDSGDDVEDVNVVRLGAPVRGLPVRRWIPPARDRLVTFDLAGKTVTDRKDQWFDDGRVAWLDLTRALRQVRDDPTAAGVALNLSATSFDTSKLWELRSELLGLQAAGKQVWIQLERPRMGTYYAASSADHLGMDPHGWVDLTGVALSRTYWAGMLDKLGLGFQEHRYFTYKSANERYSRTDLSEADREQLGRIVDVLFDEMVEGIAAGAGMSAEDVERLGEEEAILRAPEARELGLVDSTGSWFDLKETARGSGLRPVGYVAPRPTPEERWGEPPVIELLYARGASEMDAGFRGRATGDHVSAVARRGDVAALVLRAESPGGDPMAADRIADGMARLREKEIPVVVSQGSVAASAGYSICLPADRILTTPFTLTGSIGVISGWVWDDGLGDRVGLTADAVQRGSHADLRSGIRFPFLPLSLPRRPLRDDEVAILRRRILAGYDDFVARVAEARQLDDARVREIAEGRVWIGGDALERELVDGLGTLGDALDEARRRAGLGPDDEYTVREYPSRRWWRLPSFGPRIPGLSLLAGGRPDAEETTDVAYLRTLLERPGEPLELVPPGQLPPEWLTP